MVDEDRGGEGGTEQPEAPFRCKPQNAGEPRPPFPQGNELPPPPQPSPTERHWQGGRKRHWLPRTQHSLSDAMHTPSPLAAGWELISIALCYRFCSPWESDVFHRYLSLAISEGQGLFDFQQSINHLRILLARQFCLCPTWTCPTLSSPA